LLDGRISELQARAVTEASYVLPDEVLPGFEERVLKRAPEQTLRPRRSRSRGRRNRHGPRPMTITSNWNATGWRWHSEPCPMYWPSPKARSNRNQPGNSG
jgi:hypothetical protein